MGWFSQKKKVPISTIAEQLGERLVTKEISKENIIKLFGSVISDHDNIDDKLIMEWLILNMYAVVKAAEIAIDSKQVTDYFVTCFHIYVLASRKYIKSEEEREFINLVEKRYQAYIERLSPEYQAAMGDMAIGVLFSKNVGMENVMVMAIGGKIFPAVVQTTVMYLKEMSAKFEITLN